MSVSKSVIILLLVGLLLLINGGCSKTVFKEEIFQSYRVKPDSTLEVYNPNGPVEVNGWDGNEIEISAVKETTGGQSALDRVDIFIDIGQIITIETDHPPVDETEVTVSYEIKVPEEMAVGKIECFNGEINIEDVYGSLELKTSNGTITAANINGIVSARSSNGDINVSGVNGLAGLRTSNGDIDAELLDLQDDLEIITSNGSITLLLEPDLSIDLEANTSNGTISTGNLDIETTIQEQTSIAGKINDGGYKVNITTSNGSIDLDYLS
ncbi:MAG: DUF4097 family beta strand repeat-containing protein [Bacillota bacterium]